AGCDAHLVGGLGAPALAGVSLVFPLMMLMQQIANSSMGSAIAASVARAVGASRRDDASALAVHGLVIAAAMATLFGAALLIGGPWLCRALGGDGEILAAALAYSNAIFAGALAYWVLVALTSVVRGTGQPGVLAIVYIAAGLLHIALVPILVFGWGPVPPLGVAGAGIATVTSFAASASALFWWLASGRTAVTLAFRGVRFERRLFVDILRVGLPMSLQPILVNVTRVARRWRAGRLRCRRAARVRDLPAELRLQRRHARHGRHQHRRRPPRARPAQRVDGGGARGRHHRRNRAVRAGVADRLGGAVQRGA